MAIDSTAEMTISPNYGAHRLRASGAASALKVTQQAMSMLLNGRTGLSATRALRFEKAFGISAATLLRMQAAHDLAKARAQHIDVDPIAA